MPVEPDSRRYTAFSVPGRGLFHFCRMPFGLTNAPATFQRLMDRAVGHDLEPYVFQYLDDLIIATPTFEQHFRRFSTNLSDVILFSAGRNASFVFRDLNTLVSLSITTDCTWTRIRFLQYLTSLILEMLPKYVDL